MRARLLLLIGLAVLVATGLTSALVWLRLHESTALDVQIIELPASANARVALTGSGGLNQMLSRSGTLSVPSGTYNFRADPVTVASALYVAAPSTGSVLVGSGGTAHLTVDYAVVIPGTTKVLSPDQAGESVTVSPNTITAPGNPPQLTDLRIGDVIVSGVSTQTPQGLIRRVVSVTTLGGNTTVQTAPATLRDAIPRGRFSIHAEIGLQSSSTQQLAALSLVSAPVLEMNRARLTSALVPPMPRPEPRDHVASQGTSPGTRQGFDWSGSCSAVGAISEDAHFNLHPFVDFKVDWGFFSVNTVTLKAGLRQDAGASITATATAKCTFNGNTPSLRLGVITFSIGVIPVVITPELSGSGKITGTSTAGAVLGASEAFNLDAGFVYDHGNLTFVQDATPSVTWQHSIEPSAQASIEAGPMLKFDVDGLGGPDVELRFEVDSTADQTGAKVLGAIGLRASIHLAFLGFNVDHDSGDILHFEKVLAQWTTGSPTPSATGGPSASSSSPTPSATGGPSASSNPGSCSGGQTAATFCATAMLAGGQPLSGTYTGSAVFGATAVSCSRWAAGNTLEGLGTLYPLPEPDTAYVGGLYFSVSFSNSNGSLFGYSGPGTYQGHVYLDLGLRVYQDFGNPSPDATLTVNADGSGSLTFTNVAEAAVDLNPGAAESGTVTWSCA